MHKAGTLFNFDLNRREARFFKKLAVKRLFGLFTRFHKTRCQTIPKSASDGLVGTAKGEHHTALGVIGRQANGIGHQPKLAAQKARRLAEGLIVNARADINEFARIFRHLTHGGQKRGGFLHGRGASDFVSFGFR